MNLVLGESRPIYANVGTPNLGFPYFNFLGGYQLKKHPVHKSATEEKKKCGSVGVRKREDAKRLIVPITSCKAVKTFLGQRENRILAKQSNDI